MHKLRAGCVIDQRRFTADDPRVEKIPEAGCWIWMRFVNRQTGYGMITGSRSACAHRAFFEHANGPIADGLVLDHVCRTRSCVNPDHLRAVTQQQNLLARDSLAIAARNAAKTVCPKCQSDYQFTKSGERLCRRCASARELIRQRARRTAQRVS